MDSQKWLEVGDWSDKHEEDGRLPPKKNQVGDGRLSSLILISPQTSIKSDTGYA